MRITGWLQYELQQGQVTGLDGDFVPRDVLNQLFRYDVVRKVLEETGLNEHDASALAHGVLKDYPRWFAILVDIGIVDHVRSPFRCLVKDCSLPIAKVEFVQFLEKIKSEMPQSTVSPTVQPGSKRPSTSQFVGSMEMDKWEKLAALFYLRQRQHLVPQQLRIDQHYVLTDGVMPFLPIENTTSSCDDGSLLVLVHPAHHDFPPHYHATEKADDGYRVALRSLHRSIGPDNQFLLRRGSSKTDPFHLLQALASYRRREQDGTSDCLIFPFSDTNLDDVWGQSLVTGPVLPVLRWTPTQMAGLAEALAFVVRKDPEERYISLRQITPCNIQWFKHTTFRSHGWGTLHLDLRTMMIGQGLCKAPVRYFGEAYGDPYEVPVRGTMRDDAEVRCVWSLGCIYFEFLIWAVMGSTNLQRFREARGGSNSPFYSRISSDASNLADPSTIDPFEGFELTPEVCRWAEILHKGPKLRFTVRHLVEYLLGKVLVVNPAGRVSVSKLASDLGKFVSADVNSEQPEPGIGV